jgi:uncharacterized protein
MSEMTNRKLPRVLLSLIAALLLAFVIGYIGVSGFGEEPFGVEKASAQQSATGGQSALQELPKMSAATASNSISYHDDNTVEGVAKTVWRHSSNVWANLLARAGYDWVDPDLYFVYNDPVKVPYGCGNTENPKVLDPPASPLWCKGDYGIYYTVYFKVKGHYIHHYGDAAVAAVVAHEMGHHVQEMLGIRDAHKRYPYLVELQADCFAGVEMNNLYWDGALEKGDLHEAAKIMYAVGDDLPRRDPGHHGTSAERQEAFYQGYNTGDPSQCAY